MLLGVDRLQYNLAFSGFFFPSPSHNLLTLGEWVEPGSIFSFAELLLQEWDEKGRSLPAGTKNPRGLLVFLWKFREAMLVKFGEV